MIQITKGYDYRGFNVRYHSPFYIITIDGQDVQHKCTMREAHAWIDNQRDNPLSEKEIHMTRAITIADAEFDLMRSLLQTARLDAAMHHSKAEDDRERAFYQASFSKMSALMQRFDAVIDAETDAQVQAERDEDADEDETEN